MTDADDRPITHSDSVITVSARLAHVEAELKERDAEVERLRRLMREASDPENCETCRAEEDSSIRCCRCECFIAALQEDSK